MLTNDTQVVLNVAGRADGKTNSKNVQEVLTFGQLGINPNMSGTRPVYPQAEILQISVCSSISDAEKIERVKALSNAYDAATRAFNQGAGGSPADKVAKAVVEYLTHYHGFSTSKGSGRYYIGPNDISVTLSNQGGTAMFFVTGSAVWGK